MFNTIMVSLIATAMLFAVYSDAEAKKGFYIGLGATYNSIEGDFKGDSGLKGGSDVIILPKIKNGFGIDIRGGYGINDQWTVELNLMSSAHDGNWEGLTGDVNYTSFSMNGKYSVPFSETANPYFLFGISSNSLIIKKGAANISTGETGDANLSGLGANLGLGIDQYIDQHVSLNLCAMYRFVYYTQASGVDHSGTIENSRKGNGFSFMMTTSYHF